MLRRRLETCHPERAERVEGSPESTESANISAYLLLQGILRLPPAPWGPPLAQDDRFPGSHPSPGRSAQDDSFLFTPLRDASAQDDEFPDSGQRQ